MLSRVLAALAMGALLPLWSLQAMSATEQPVKPPLAEPENAASPARMRLISQEQYANSIAYVFGPDIMVSAHFAPFRRTDGLLANGSAAAGVTLGQIQEFQRTAGALAGTIVSSENRSFLVPCAPRRADAADQACARSFLSAIGRLLHRRALADEVLDEVVAEAGAAADRLRDFHGGLAVALEGLLLAPDALFVIEHSEPDPDHAGRRRLDRYSLASRLSFFLWNAAPDDALLRAAERGELHTQRGLAAQLDRMLASPRLETGVRAFFDDMLRFDDFAVLAKDPSIYPSFGGETVVDAREQTLRTLVDHLLVKQRDYRDLFTTRETFLSPAVSAEEVRRQR